MKWNRRRKRLVAALLCGLIALLFGLLLWQYNFGSPLRRASYDLPFLFGSTEPPKDIALVYLDEASLVDLEQPIAQPLDRRIHAGMVQRLDDAGARMIIFDILFHDAKPAQDAMLAEAMRAHGQTVLIGEYVLNRSETAERESLLLAAADLRRAAVGSGLSTVPLESDGVIRRVPRSVETPFGTRPTLSEFVRGVELGETEAEPGLLHYYGPSGTFPGYSYSGVLRDVGVPEDAFRDKIVLIGAKQSAGLFGAGKDTFSTPYTRIPVYNDQSGQWERALTPGVEIQATAIANLLQGQQVTSLGDKATFSMLCGLPFLFAAVACMLSPLRGLSLCLLLAVAVSVIGIMGQRAYGIHSLWTIPSFGQMALVVALALVAHYLIEYSARWKLRSAFKSYMSDEQARQIDEEEVSLELGGKEVEATILFSDLAGFTSMSEGLPPQSVSKALISYFESATEGILDNNGTIIKYVGDAVMATWGAPLKVDREADRAIDAAIQMQIAGRKPISLQTGTGVHEQVLETRVGINHGLGLAGNLGSRRRFDYSVIGDTTNTAARLEGLNKMLGTSVLISEAVLKKCEEPERYLTRKMGCYVLKGKSRGIVVHEVLGYRGSGQEKVRERSEAYLQTYAKGLAAFEAGDLAQAAESLQASLRHHDRLAEDPASALLLQAIQDAGDTPNALAQWSPDIFLSSK